MRAALNCGAKQTLLSTMKWRMMWSRLSSARSERSAQAPAPSRCSRQFVPSMIAAEPLARREALSFAWRAAGLSGGSNMLPGS